MVTLFIDETDEPRIHPAGVAASEDQGEGGFAKCTASFSEGQLGAELTDAVQKLMPHEMETRGFYQFRRPNTRPYTITTSVFSGPASAQEKVVQGPIPIMSVREGTS
eukprot:NODE_1316_length_620_cov_241.044266_g1304_i0.p1 GENE.NODE_1316_length_620_cov_241.044266_g1304_i0~~NODE_1316_length_620_cov_241.044266_g1304_i0.p1  ORF type:complete len:107 (+),score=2.56 NODE_1316_length_620_cov_241.044266_g1304_i0:131-451(+)